jgi:hypothetical protein
MTTANVQRAKVFVSDESFDCSSVSDPSLHFPNEVPCASPR